MSILIKGMEMPKSCFKCRLSRITPSSYAYCSLNEKCYPADETPPPDCPIVSVPQHGRLVDGDALIKTLGIGELPIRLTNEIINAPTIIPADKDINVLGKEDGE